MQITEKIQASINKGNIGCGIFIDQRNAIDKVKHDILLLKLEHNGIRGNMFNWFKSYLINRQLFLLKLEKGKVPFLLHCYYYYTSVIFGISIYK